MIEKNNNLNFKGNLVESDGFYSTNLKFINYTKNKLNWSTDQETLTEIDEFMKSNDLTHGTTDHFNSFFYQEILRKHLNFLKTKSDQKSELNPLKNFDYIPLKILILSLPFCEKIYTANYLSQKFGLKNIRVLDYIKELLRTTADQMSSELNSIKKKIFDGFNLGKEDCNFLVVKKLKEFYRTDSIANFLRIKENEKLERIKAREKEEELRRTIESNNNARTLKNNPDLKLELIKGLKESNELKDTLKLKKMMFKCKSID